MLLTILLGQGAGVTHYTLAVDPTSFSLTDQTVALSVGRALNVTAASYSYTTANPTLSISRAVSVDATSYTNTTATVAFLRGLSLPVTVANYAWTPVDAALIVAKNLSVSADSLGLTTATATLTADRVLAADAVGVEIAFLPVALDYGQPIKQLTVDPLAVVLTHQNPSLAVERTLTVAQTSSTVDFATAAFAIDRAIVVDAASFAVEAQPVSLTVNRFMSVEAVGKSSYVAAGYVASGYVDSQSYSLTGKYVADGYVNPTYVGDVGLTLSVERYLNLEAFTVELALGTATFTITSSAVYPAPGDVRMGVAYGPTGMEFTGTLSDDLLKYEIETGRMILSVSREAAILL